MLALFDLSCCFKIFAIYCILQKLLVSQMRKELNQIQFFFMQVVRLCLVDRKLRPTSGEFKFLSIIIFIIFILFFLIYVHIVISKPSHLS